MPHQIPLEDILEEVFHIGVGKATASLSEMLEQTIEMEVPKVIFLNKTELKIYIKENSIPHICILQKIEGGLTGIGILSFLPEVSKKFVHFVMPDLYF